jgi:hypothetical protein
MVYLTMGMDIRQGAAMTRSTLSEALLGAIREVQVMSGQQEPELTESTRPEYDLPDFDSIRFIEVESILAQRLQIDIDLRSLRTDKNLASLPIGEMVDLLLHHLAPEVK